MGFPRNETDLLVVGGGPAGLATAIRASQAGLSVRLIDRAVPPIDKACGEGLMPDGLTKLRQLGFEPAAEACAPIRGIRYIDGERVAEGLLPGSGGMGMRRIELHRAMARLAEDVGVDLRWGVTARGLDDGVITDQGLFRARWLVGADGLHSRVRRWAGLEGAAARRRRYGVRRHYAVEPWSEFVEVYWGEAVEAYVTPVSPRSVGVALLWSGGRVSFDRMLERFPNLNRRLVAAPVDSEDRGSGPLEQRVRSVVRDNLALVGDASGYLDAITGEGLALAFHHAFAVVEAIVRRDLAAYAAAHRRLARLPGFMTRSLLLVERHPWLRSRLINALAADPRLFARLLAVHARAARPRRLAASGVSLAWRILASGGNGDVYETGVSGTPKIEGKSSPRPCGRRSSRKNHWTTTPLCNKVVGTDRKVEGAQFDRLLLPGPSVAGGRSTSAHRPGGRRVTTVPKFIDTHPMQPFTADQLNKLQTAPPDEFGVTHHDILFSEKDNKIYCVLDAPNAEAVHKHHAKAGINCEFVHEVKSTRR